MNSIYIPCILQESSEGITRIPIQDAMLQRREVELTGEINRESANALIVQLRHLARVSDEEITMYVSSPGGEVQSGLAIYDVKRAVPCRIRTVCVGTAASMAAIIFAAGDTREILPHACVMVHDPLTNGMGGSALSVQESCNRLMNIRKTLCSILAEHTGKKLKQIYKVTAKDTYFNSIEAVSFGHADRVIESFERRSA